MVMVHGLLPCKQLLAPRAPCTTRTWSTTPIALLPGRLLDPVLRLLCPGGTSSPAAVQKLALPPLVAWLEQTFRPNQVCWHFVRIHVCDGHSACAPLVQAGLIGTAWTAHVRQTLKAMHNAEPSRCHIHAQTLQRDFQQWTQQQVAAGKVDFSVKSDGSSKRQPLGISDELVLPEARATQLNGAVVSAL